MRLIGMLDSPYVRRVAISLDLLGLPFAHEAISVFAAYDDFAAINPVVKAPTLVTEDGVVLIASGLILDYAERLSTPERRLMPADPAQFAKTARVIGLAMAACEKTVQIIYEMNLRPADKRHQPWLDRVHGQLRAAYALLEAEVRAGGEWLHAARPMQADVSAAVAWRFTQSCLSDALDAGAHPKLIALSERAEALPPFAAAPPT